MKKYRSNILFVTLFLLAGCQIGTQVQSPDWEAEEENQILFFSDEDYVNLEDAYYDAMLELKKIYPDEMKNIKIMSVEKNADLVKKYEINEYPCLIFFKQSEMKTKIEGKQNKAAITEKLEQVLADE